MTNASWLGLGLPLAYAAGMAAGQIKWKPKKPSSITSRDGLKQKQNLGETMDFPTALKRVHYALKDQYMTGSVDESDQLFMLDLLKRGMIGMDGFKFCLVEEAKANREIMLRSMK